MTQLVQHCLQNSPDNTGLVMCLLAKYCFLAQPKAKPCYYLEMERLRQEIPLLNQSQPACLKAEDRGGDSCKTCPCPAKMWLDRPWLEEATSSYEGPIRALQGTSPPDTSSLQTNNPFLWGFKSGKETQRLNWSCRMCLGLLVHIYSLLSTLLSSI